MFLGVLLREQINLTQQPQHSICAGCYVKGGCKGGQNASCFAGPDNQNVLGLLLLVHKSSPLLRLC